MSVLPPFGPPHRARTEPVPGTDVPDLFPTIGDSDACRQVTLWFGANGPGNHGSGPCYHSPQLYEVTAPAGRAAAAESCWHWGVDSIREKVIRSRPCKRQRLPFGVPLVPKLNGLGARCSIDALSVAKQEHLFFIKTARPRLAGLGAGLVFGWHWLGWHWSPDQCACLQLSTQYSALSTLPWWCGGDEGQEEMMQREETRRRGRELDECEYRT
jgi:hypothetical protein